MRKIDHFPVSGVRNTCTICVIHHSWESATQGNFPKIDHFPASGGFPWVADNTSTTAFLFESNHTGSTVLDLVWGVPCSSTVRLYDEQRDRQYGATYYYYYIHVLVCTTVQYCTVLDL